MMISIKIVLLFVFSFMFGSMANQSCLIYLNNPETLTKTGVLHKKTFQNNNRVRYFFHYKNGTDKMLEDEVKFWIETAKKEHFFVTDRSIKYEPQTT